jgi:raffinose/stachyose/melibiose transport system permease protein
MIQHNKRIIMKIAILVITVLMVFPFLWMLLLSFKTNAEILSSPLAFPKSFNLANYMNAGKTLNFLRLYGNTILVCVISLVVEVLLTFLSSFVIARMVFRNRKIVKFIYGFLIMGLSISPFILLFPVYRINVLFGLKEQWALILPYIATSISFNTLLLVGYLKALPSEIDEAAIIDGCNIWDLMFRIIFRMAKPVIATIVIFNVLYIWNEFPFASVMLRDISNYTLSMGTSFFKGTYTVDYGGIVAASVMIIIPELIFYGIFQRNIVEGMTAGAVKG